MINATVAGRKAKEARVRAVVTRADGRIEDRGTIAYYHRNPLRRWGFWVVKYTCALFGRVI